MATRLRRKLERLQARLLALGPICPGRVTRQENVCGKAGCRCKDPRHPRKHGPYHYLSFTFRGRSRTMFVPVDCLEEMTRRTRDYEEFRRLVEEWIEVGIELARKEVLGFDEGR